MPLDYAQIPAELRDIFKELEDELIWLHGRWSVYRQLFGTNERRIELLNHSAPTFFGILQDLWFDHIIVGICRLTDNPEISGRKNLVVGQLLNQLDMSSHPVLVTELQRRLADIKGKSNNLRSHRNRKVAHLDLQVALGVEETPIPGISRQDIEDVLATLRSFMNSFRVEFLGSPMSYESFTLRDDGERLIVNLMRAAAFRELEKADPHVSARWADGPFKNV